MFRTIVNKKHKKKNYQFTPTHIKGQRQQKKSMVFRKNKLTKTFIKSLRIEVTRGNVPNLPSPIKTFLKNSGRMLNENSGRLIKITKANIKANTLQDGLEHPEIQNFEDGVMPGEVYPFLAERPGQYLILSGAEGEVRFHVPTERIAAWWASNRWRMMEDSERPLFKNGATLYRAQGVEGKKIKQSFRDGYEHCFYEPIIKMVKEKLKKYPKLKKGKNSKNHINKRSELNKILKYCEKHRNDGGVHQDMLQEIAIAINARIVIDFPFTGDKIDVKPNVNYNHSFKFNNISFNHLHACDNLRMDGKPEYVENIELTDDILYWKENKTGDILKAWRKDGAVLTSSEQSGNYYEFVKENSQYSLRSQTPISEFIEASCVYNNSMNLHTEKEIDLDKIYQMDEKKCYLQSKNTPFYNGLGIILTTFEVREFTLEEVKQNAGFYQLREVEYTRQFPDHIFEAEGRVMYSAEILYLASLNIKFRIVAGAYGEQGDTIDDIDLHKYFDDEDKSYRKAVGRFNCVPKHDTFKMKSTEGDYYKHLVYLANRCDDKERTRVFCTKEGVYDIVTPAKPKCHYSTITSMILSYARIRMIEFVRTSMNWSNVLRINTDGVYLRNNLPKETDTMRYKPIELKSNETFFAAGTYLVFHNPYYQNATSKNKKQINYYKGAGGSGKTETLCTDKTNVALCVFSPTWKLVKHIKDKYPVNCSTWAKLKEETQKGQSLKRVIKNYNVWAFDEVSMMSNEFKNYIIDLAKKHNKKIIFMGDVGYQLPCFGEGETPFTNDGIEHTVPFTHNYRFYPGDDIRRIAKHLRQMMRDKYLFKSQLKWTLKQDNIKIQKYEDIKPTVNDMIITSTKKNINGFNTKYKNGIPELIGWNEGKTEYDNYNKYKKKWYIKANSSKYKNQEIVIQNTKPDTQCVEQYAFTIHSVQGETISPPNRLYIDVRRMWAREHLYTAISRARSLKQIIFIVD